MPTVRKEITIAAAPEDVFAIAQDVERFPEVMHDLKKVEVLERDGGRTVTRWTSVAEIGPLSKEIAWEEEDVWDATALTCTFKMTKGDMQAYAGVWSFARDGAVTNVVLDITYEIEIPLLGALVHKIIRQKMDENCDSLLKALKRLAEKKEG
jgi:uncharacterized membrane protein